MKYWIWLSTLPYIGTVSARKIITVLKNPKNVYYSSEEELRKIGNLTLRQRNSILMNRELENAKRIIASGIDTNPILLYGFASFSPINALALFRSTENTRPVSPNATPRITI